MGDSLKNKTVKGAIWAAIQRFGGLTLSFVANMILARLLAPDAFGAMAMLTIFIAVSDTFMDSGMGSALIQKKDLSIHDSCTVFYFNIGVALVLYGILFISAPWIADFYNITLLKSVLRTESLVLLINSLGVVQIALLRKEMQFKKLTISNLAASLIGTTTAVCLAFLGFGIWALVFQMIVVSISRVTMLWFQSSWRPKMIISRKSFKDLFGFGSFIFFSNLINTICNKIQGVIIGKAFNATTLGYYSQASALENVASNSFASIIDQVAYPALASKQNNLDTIRKIINKFIQVISFATIPLMMGLALLGAPIIEVCYGVKWLPAVPYFQILCFAGIAGSLQNINFYAVAAIGKSKSLFLWTIVKRSVSLAMLLVGLIWGMKGFLIGLLISFYLSWFINALQVHIYIGYTVWNQTKAILHVLVGAVIAYVLAVLITHIIYLDNTIVYLIQAAIYISCIFVYTMLFCKDTAKDVVDIFKELIKKKM